MTAAQRWRRPWPVAFAGAALMLAVLHLAGLGTAPPGLYNDEASIGYNAWAIAHHGIDEHGHRFPLFFEAFGEYKNPLYIYLLAPLTWVLPLTSWVVRLPAALSGIGIAGVSAGIGWRLSGSRRVAMLMLVCTGLEPWTWQESRVAFEPIVMVFLLVLASLLVLRATPGSRRHFPLAGAAISLAVFTYTTARLFGVLMLVAIALSYARSPFTRWWSVFTTSAPGYVILGVWALIHPGALLARYNTISVGSDGAGLPAQLGRVIVNYVQYTGISFLFTDGDANLRHSSGLGGMLSVVMAPVLVAGLVVCVRRWRDPPHRFTLLGLLAAPLPASLTADGTPHSLRAATMLPFIVLLLAFGFTAILPAFTAHRVALAVAVVAIGLSYGRYLQDYFLNYPDRSFAVWDAGEGQTIARAHELALGGHVLLSEDLDAPYIQALFFLKGTPTAQPDHGLSALNMEVADPYVIAAAAREGDVVVLVPGDPAPPNAQPIADDEYAVTHRDQPGGQNGRTVSVLAVVYRIARRSQEQAAARPGNPPHVSMKKDCGFAHDKVA